MLSRRGLTGYGVAVSSAPERENRFQRLYARTFLILAVAFSQLLSAVLPILIIVCLVPAQDRAALMAVASAEPTH
jgi:hypothetical protein